MGEAPSVSLDDFARVTARIQKGVSRERALADAGIDEEKWFASQQAWLSRMARRVAAGDRRLHDRFLERLRAFDEEELSNQPELEGELPRAPDRRMPPKPAARPKRRPKAPVVMVRTKEPEDMPVRTKEPEDMPVHTMAFEIPPQAGSALPFSGKRAGAPIPGPSIALMDEFAAAGETLDGASDTLDGETLPADTLDAAGETLDPDTARGPRKPALPFDDMPTSTLEPAPLAGSAMPFQAPAGGMRKRGQNPALPFRAPVDPLSSTQTGDALPVPRPALPFRSEPGAPKARARQAEGGLPFRRPAAAKAQPRKDESRKDEPRKDESGKDESRKDEPRNDVPRKNAPRESTMALTAEELANAGGKTDAFAGTVALSIEELGTQPRLTIEQFASLTAEIAIAPRELAALEQRYGLGAGGHDREKRAWAMRFLSEPKLSAEYATKVRQYRAWLARPR